jgi:hypothetical protein
MNYEFSSNLIIIKIALARMFFKKKPNISAELSFDMKSSTKF